MTDAEVVARGLCKLRGWHEDSPAAWAETGREDPGHEWVCARCGAKGAELGIDFFEVRVFDTALGCRWPT